MAVAELGGIGVQEDNARVWYLYIFFIVGFCACNLWKEVLYGKPSG